MDASPILYFDDGHYWLCLPSGRFLCLRTNEARLHLRDAGLFAGEPLEKERLNGLERALLTSMQDCAVDYAGPLAGHRRGPFLTSSGLRVLVTSEAAACVWQVPKSTKDFPRLRKFLSQLFGSEQLPYVLAWLKYAGNSLRLGDFRPGQVLALAGPSGCGKSLFQCLITEFLGGRSARPYRYMVGLTAFNSELAAAEHLVIEDEHASTDIRARRHFGASLKDFTVNSEMSIHAKGREARALRTFKRVSLSVNHEPENLMILPPLDESLIDKIMLLRCWPATIGEDRLEVWSSLSSELPALRAHLYRWRVPRSMKEPRFGVVSYHNPELLSLLADISPETRLCNLIDQVLTTSDFCERVADGKEVYIGKWSGSAEALEVRLLSSQFNFAVQKLLYFTSACGVYLARLAARYPERFSSEKRAGKTVWTIKAP